MARKGAFLCQTLSIFLLCTQISQVLSTEGVLFFLAYVNPSTNNASNPGIQEIHVSGSQNKDTKVRIQVLPQNYTYMYQLDSTNKWSKTLTIYPDLSGPFGVKLPASVIVSSQQPISVQSCKSEEGTSGGYLALPITELSTDFYVASYTPRTVGPSFTIAAPYYTCITIYAENGPSKVREIDVSLDPGQVWSWAAPADTTGLHIQSRKPIAVYSGLDCAYIADSASPNKCDNIVEQLHPTGQYGQVFIAASFYGRRPDTGFQLRVMATIRTEVRWAVYDVDPATGAVGAPVVNGPVTVLRGKFQEIKAGGTSSKPVIVMLTCTQPCEVMQYGESNDMTPVGTENGVKPDSTMVTVPGLNHYTTDITFSTSKLYTVAGNLTLDNFNGLTIIAKQSDLDKLKLDGQSIMTALPNAKKSDVTFPSGLQGSGSEVTLPSQTYTVVYGGEITPGFHRVTCDDPSLLYMVVVYGHAKSSNPPSDSSGYAYLGGMRYAKLDDNPVVEGPWFDFSAPPSETPIIDNGNPGIPVGPTEPIIPTEYPSYESIWEDRFYVLKPQRADLKTRNCSEAYERYYMQERFAPMKSKVEGDIVSTQCTPGCTVNMTHLLYYSEYTDGLIRFKLSVSAKGDVPLSDVLDCLASVTDEVSALKNWVPNYVDETDFLRPDAYYNRGCDQLHMRKPNFDSPYFGWNCPTKDGKVGSNDARTMRASVGLLAGLAMIVSLMIQLR